MQIHLRGRFILLSLYEFNRKIGIKWSAVNATQLSCIKVKHILKIYFLNYYFLGFYKYILQNCFEDFPLKMYTLSVSSQSASRQLRYQRNGLCLH